MHVRASNECWMSPHVLLRLIDSHDGLTPPFLKLIGLPLRSALIRERTKGRLANLMLMRSDIGAGGPQPSSWIARSVRLG